MKKAFTWFLIVFSTLKVTVDDDIYQVIKLYYDLRTSI